MDIFLSIVLTIILLGLLILGHEFGHFIIARKAGMKVLEFGFGFPPKLWSRKKGDTVYSVNAIPFGGFVKIHGEDSREPALEDPTRTFNAKSRKWQAAVVVAGVLSNIVLAWILLSLGLMLGIPTDHSYTEIAGIVPETAAAEAELLPGDLIEYIEYEGSRIDTPSPIEIRRTVQESSGAPVSLGVVRSGAVVPYELSPRTSTVNDGAYTLGIEMGLVPEKQPFWKAPFVGVVRTFELTKSLVVEHAKLIGGAFNGDTSLDQVGGPIVITQMVGQAFDLGIPYLLYFGAFLSVSLAIINILPIPALDGGRLLFIIIEGIYGKPIRPDLQAIINGIGFLLLLLLLFVVTIHDIVRIFSN